jgi:hypothetical protein
LHWEECRNQTPVIADFVSGLDRQWFISAASWNVTHRPDDPMDFADLAWQVFAGIVHDKRNVEEGRPFPNLRSRDATNPDLKWRANSPGHCLDSPAQPGRCAGYYAKTNGWPAPNSSSPRTHSIGYQKEHPFGPATSNPVIRLPPWQSTSDGLRSARRLELSRSLPPLNSGSPRSTQILRLFCR